MGTNLQDLPEVTSLLDDDILHVRIIATGKDEKITRESLQSMMMLIGSAHKFFTYKDRSSLGLLPFAFDNVVSQTAYDLLYAEVGDIFETQHTDAGDDASDAGMFYPTPIPGAYDRVGIPDLTINGTTLTLHSAFRNGTLFLVKSGTNQPIGTEIFIRRTGTSTVTYHSSEAGAIANTGAITVTGIGILTQEGIAIDDAFRGHWHEVRITNATGDGHSEVPSTRGAGGGTTIQQPWSPGVYNARNAYTDGINGPVTPTNETRPKTNYLFGYIKANY